MRIAFDLDNVIYPFVSVLGDYVAEVTGQPRTNFPDATKWEFYEDWGMDAHTFMGWYRDGVNDNYVFSLGEPIPGSVDTLYELQAAGHTNHLVTDRFVGTVAQANTERWLCDNDVPYDSITYTQDKTIVDADVLFDDKPEHVDAWRALRRKAYLFPHNGDFIREDQVHHPSLCGGWDHLFFSPLRIVDGILNPPGEWVEVAGEMKWFAADEVPQATESPLQEALRLVHGPRQESYGHPIDNFTQTGRLWGAILNREDVSPEEVALMMIAAKISRETHAPKGDNRTDMAGYTETLHLVIEERKRRDSQ